MGNSGSENHPQAKISAVIFDLDGTLLNTEAVGRAALKEFLGKFGKVLNTDSEHRRVGRTQKETAAAMVEEYDLPLTRDRFIEEINPLYRARWAEAKPLPGATRLISHLHKQQVPLALASNSLRDYIDAKISHHKGWKECFSVILGSDQVKAGKPAPDLFLEAAKRLEVEARNCLVVEDSLVGVQAAKAAGIRVVAVPSHGEGDAAFVADFTLQSLLEFQPEVWGLPPFNDWVDKALPIDHIYFDGLFSGGFVAEFPGKSEQDDGPNVLPDQVSGVYFGWAKVSTSAVFKVVVGFGWERSSAPQRKIQVTLVDGRSDHLCNQQLQLFLVGYIRGFSCKENENLKMEIREEDVLIARVALDKPMFVYHSEECVVEAVAP